MPEFPLSRPDLKGTDEPREYRGRSGMDFEGAKHWRLVQVQYYANLQPSQIVREMDAPDRGWEADPAKGDEHSPRAARQDATADSDRQRENTGLVTVDERRYVVDPIVDGHTFTGLWTGGPIQHYVAKDNHKYLRQTLTRTWCAGHGYTVAEDGAYIAEWPASFDDTTGEPATWTETTPDGYGGVHGTSGNKDKEHSDAPLVREYRTAVDCLKACRPWMEGRLSPYMVFRTDIPASYTREVYWREFTHESITPLERLGKDVEKLREVIAYHFGAEVAGNVLDAHTRVDPATNTVIFVCSLLYTDLAEPEDPDELLKLPVIDAPCTRDTLRMFGWNQLRNGEGYKYSHVFRWPRLKDTKKTRATIEFIRDNTTALDASFLPKLLDKHRPNSKTPGLWTGYEVQKPVSLDSDEKDQTGRLVTTTDTGTYTGGPTATPEVQHYRIAQQKTDVEQDGSLSFSIVIAKSEWHGYDDGQDYENGGQRQLAGVSAPQGFGITEHRVIPSVPRENAIDTMVKIKARDKYELVTQKSQSEGQEGSSDVSFQRKPLYDYIDPDHTPDNLGPDTVTGNIFNAPSYSFDPNTNTYHLGWSYVTPDKVQDLINDAKAKLGGNPIVKTEYHPEGYYSVSITGKGKEPKHVPEWCVSADWFKHETQESWLGVTVYEVNGVPQGFYKEYQKNADGSYVLDGNGNPVPILSSLVPFAEIRGDLDADWMGSDPQKQGAGPRAAVLFASTGVENAHTQNIAPKHADEHGDGWNTYTKWEDPDDSGNNADKKRLHVITSVRPRRNEDGTYDISIHRVYPHQRVWEWETEKRSGKGGEWKPVYHIEYRNWPSRHAIKTDLVDRWAAIKGVNLASDEYIFTFSPNVNQFGLVDAANVTIEPLFWNPSKSKASTETGGLEDCSDYRFYASASRPSKARVSPDSVDHAPPFAPLLGFYFCVEKLPCYEGNFNDYASAKTAWDALEEKYGEADSSSTTPHQVGSSTRYHFIYRGGWRRGKIAYNGMMPVVAKNQHGHSVGSTTKQGIKGLSRKTWELWFMGAENMGH